MLREPQHRLNRKDKIMAKKWFLTMDGDGERWDVAIREKAPSKDRGQYPVGFMSSTTFPELNKYIHTLVKRGQCIEIKPFEIKAEG